MTCEFAMIYLQLKSSTIIICSARPVFSYPITACRNPEKLCSIFPGMGKQLHLPLEDLTSLVSSALKMD